MELILKNDSDGIELQATYDRSTGGITLKTDTNNDITDYDIRFLRYVGAEILRRYAGNLSSSSATLPKYDDSDVTIEDLNA